MSNLIKVNGLRQIENMKFHDIEGGFGEGKKAMLAREIATIHGRDIKDINRNINNNIERFKKNIDILDLKTGEYKSLVLEMGFTNAQYGNANNIYLLSERGYAKLLKILEDDFAWEQYDKLVDGYFNMRGQAQKPMTAMEMLELQFKATKEIESRVIRVEEFVDEAELSMADSKRLTKNANGIVVRALGGKKSNAYQELSKKVFADLYKQLHREFGVTSISEIKKKHVEAAREIINNYKPPRVLVEEINKLNNQMKFKECI